MSNEESRFSSVTDFVIDATHIQAFAKHVKDYSWNYLQKEFRTNFCLTMASKRQYEDFIPPIYI